MNRLFTLIILLTLSFTSYATITGNDIIHNCSKLLDTEKMTGMADFAEAASCSGYLDGLNDMTMLFQTMLETTFYCLPQNGIESGQLIRVSIKWLEANPEVLHESMRSLFVSVMKDTFPCDNQSTQ